MLAREIFYPFSRDKIYARQRRALFTPLNAANTRSSTRPAIFMMSLNYFEKLAVNDINSVALRGARHRRRVGESQQIGGRAADEFVEVPRSCGLWTYLPNVL